ncbi:PREDICTED: putative F-box protein At4g29970 [Camelina sativa]|uniref:F-box protein At4g29970 n=1 Tax=Camelina sativa TaxID=90675 RepID=A0ABM0V5K2_CAMSA|nr:PREDICTED: putative F-box protein At4g29970 [Camelina sativa]
MGKVKKKNRQCLTRSKKRDESEEIDLYSNIPPELILEILLKSPAKSIVKLSFVSRYWSSIIRDKDFTELYLTHSITRPRLLFTVNRLDMHFFVSRSLEDHLLSSDDHHRDRVTLTPKPDSRYCISPPVRGLICCYNENIETEEHQVLTLGANQEWRMIESKVDIRFFSLISFNLMSEDFNVIELPDRRFSKLVNYGGKIALTDGTICRGTLDLWVLKDFSNQEWSKCSLLVPSLTNLVGDDECFTFRGALRTGELIFVPFYYKNPKPFSFICYDLNVNHARKVVIEGLGNDHRAKVFLDHVESPMFLRTNGVLIQ